MKIVGYTVGTSLPKPDFKQTDPNKGDYIKNKPDFAGLKSKVDEIEEALVEKQPVGDYALKNEIPSIEGLATEKYVDEAVAGIEIPEGSSAIIDVTELPTENIQEGQLYRLLTGTFYWNGAQQNDKLCYVVDTLPETGEPATNAEMTELRVYYNLETETPMGYIDAMLSYGLGIPSGWYPAEQLFPVAGINYGGIIRNEAEATGVDTLYLLLGGVLYHYNGVWNIMRIIGWAGSAPGSEIFNSLTNVASGATSHAEGFRTKATGNSSHAEGNSSHAEGESSHAEGESSHAEGNSSHAEGFQSHAKGHSSHAEGERSYAEGHRSHAEGYYSHAKGEYSHAEGEFSYAKGLNSHAEGSYSHAEGSHSHAEGSYSHAEGSYSHAEGKYNYTQGNHSHVEGYASYVSGDNSHAEGYASYANGVSSHAEGLGDYVILDLSGNAGTTTYQNYSSIPSNVYVGMSVRMQCNKENVGVTYSAARIVSIDTSTNSITVNSTLSDTAVDHAPVIGYCSGMAIGDYSHKEGNRGIALGRSQHVQGEFNVVDPEGDQNDLNARGKYADIVGNGSSHENRSNASALDWNGNAYYAGDVYVNGDGKNDFAGMKKLATEEYVDSKASAGGSGAAVQADWNTNDETDLSYVKNRTHYEAPPSFDITWDGVIGDRFALDMSQFGFDGVYFVKVSDYVPTLEEMIGAKIVDEDGYENVSYLNPEDCDAYNYPGVYDIRGWVIVCYDSDTLSSAIGIPSGIITNGTYFYAAPEDGYYTSRFVGRDNSKKLDTKYLPEGYPYETEPKFNIIWNGDMTGRTTLDMSPLGYEGFYFVKVSDIVPSEDDVIGSSYVFNWNYNLEISDITTSEIYNSYPGSYDIRNEIVVVHDQNTLNSTLGLPEDYMTNGVYFVANPTNKEYIARFSGVKEIKKLDNKYLPDFQTDVYSKAEVDDRIANAIGGAIGGSY